VGWSGATGTLANGELIVRFSLKMELSDFEDAAYRQTSDSILHRQSYLQRHQHHQGFTTIHEAESVARCSSVTTRSVWRDVPRSAIPVLHHF
jgi:hypothetical protein